MTRRIALSPLLAAFFLPAIFLCACADGARKAVDPKRPIRVTATVGMVGDLVREVGGSRVQVTTLMGPGVDPHLYKASEGDLGRLQDADLIFYNGLFLEGKMAELLAQLRERGKAAIAVAEAIDPSHLRTPPEFQGHHDPHVWFDVSLWIQTIPPVVEALAKLDPANRSQFEENAARYRGELEALHSDCLTQLAKIPRERRVLVTAHDAFGYFGRAYDVDVIGLQGISTSAEYGLQDVNRLVTTIVERKVRAVFVESSVSSRSIEAVVEGCRARGHDVRVGGQLFSDAMGEAGTPEENYIGMVRFNVKTMVEAL